ncbi:hypothetical protein ACFY1L_15825 [Streptomyces sp. NPDC001663]|uniref:hypothetical protein n=1 Tax=Streptomyces sp. NPDC001663 TaxID=3364597 RepID=UPI0036740B2A
MGTGVTAPQQGQATEVDFLKAEHVPVEKLALVVEVVPSGSRQQDRVRKPALFAAAEVQMPFPVEIDLDALLGF